MAAIVRSLMRALGGLGDIAFILPAAVALTIALILLGARREAGAFVSALVACAVLMTAEKLAFAVCGRAAVIPGIDSPSGHAALGSAFYGCCAALLAAGRPPVQRMALYALAVLLALAVAYGRVAAQAHTVAEVIVGLLTGAVATALFVVLRGPPRRLTAPPVALTTLTPLILALLALDLALLSDRWTAESYIAQIALALGRNLHLCR
ncbi:MAG: phosphatase PAP2 family protein [Bradyrhizobium sp.]|nr:MAG: phosphatase PAP2 family protein [Bradyrhizobium sp.]